MMIKKKMMSVEPIEETSSWYSSTCQCVHHCSSIVIEYIKSMKI